MQNFPFGANSVLTVSAPPSRIFNRSIELVAHDLFEYLGVWTGEYNGTAVDHQTLEKRRNTPAEYNTDHRQHDTRGCCIPT